MAHTGAGDGVHWRRWWGTLVQVMGCAGAGVEKEVGPAPREGMGARFMAQVPDPKTHLRQYGVSPAPK